MKQHEREFFISQIRSGRVNVVKNHQKLVIFPLTIDQSVEACEVYNEAYQQAYIDEMMTESEIENWMREKELWTHIDDNKIEGLKKDLEKLKVEIYNARNNIKLKETIRLYIRAGENQLATHLSKKNSYYQNSAEGYASSEKAMWIIKNTTYCNNLLYDFSDISLSYIMDEWQSSFLNDSKCRELARTEPWKSLWVIKNNSNIKLFNNEEDHELTYNQKNLIIWSQMYDNIQESLECPQKDVIEDDDMLDGWFIVQAKKREQERAEQELQNNTKSDKIKNASEVFLVAKEKQDANRVESMNSVQSANIKKQRSALVNKKGTVEQIEFMDEKLKIQSEHNSKFKGRNRGG